MRSRSRRFAKFALVVIVAAAAFAAVWVGLVPASYLPFSRIDLSDPSGPFLDWRLAALRNDRDACAQVIAGAEISARPVSDNPYETGCGWINAVRLSTAAGVRVPAAQITCQTAAALTLWLQHEVQPIARGIFGQPVTSVAHMGTYSCRNIIGSSRVRWVRSEHAKANAIDIAAFVLADGRRISLRKHWFAGGREADFLHRIHERSCRYFRVSLSPNFNKAHADHFHFDRGPLWTCR